jgi:hypothetical protein
VCHCKRQETCSLPHNNHAASIRKAGRDCVQPFFHSRVAVRPCQFAEVARPPVGPRLVSVGGSTSQRAIGAAELVTIVLPISEARGFAAPRPRFGIKCTPAFNSSPKAWERNRCVSFMESDRSFLRYSNGVGGVVRRPCGSGAAALRTNQDGLYERRIRAGRRKYRERAVA